MTKNNRRVVFYKVAIPVSSAWKSVDIFDTSIQGNTNEKLQPY